MNGRPRVGVRNPFRRGLSALGWALVMAVAPQGVCAAEVTLPVAATVARASEPDSERGEASSGRMRVSGDPFEGFNRRVMQFNEAIDAAAVRPIALFYDRYTPGVVRLIVRNVLSNLLDPYIAVNNFLQGKPAAGFSDLGRFALNSTFGFFGFGDPASDVGLEKHREDFGQTLGVWGVPSGPFLMLPLFGPSGVRDGVGFAVDVWGALIGRFDNVAFRNTLAVTEFVDTRARLLPADRALADALDRYLLVRDSYLQRRRYLIHDGDPPEDPDAP